jgi:hypothetical protein
MPTYINSKTSVYTDVVVSIGPLTGTSSPTYTVIGEVFDVQKSGAKRTVLNPTNFNSTAVEKLDAPLADYGQVKLSFNRVSNDPGQEALIAAFNAGGSYLFKVQLPPDPKLGQTGTGATGDLYSFSAIISAGPEFGLSLDKLTQPTVTLEINGADTLTAGAAGS